MKNEMYKSIIEELDELFVYNLEFNQENVVKVGFLSKYIKSVKAISLLDENGFFEDAHILTRSIFEIMINAIYCEINDNYSRYARYSSITQYKYIQTIKKRNLIDRIPTSTESRIIEEYNEFLKDYDIDDEKDWVKINNWNGISFYRTVNEISEKLNNEYIKILYEAIYVPASEYVHSNSLSVQRYLDFESIDERVFAYKPDPFLNEEYHDIYKDVSEISKIFIQLIKFDEV